MFNTPVTLSLVYQKNLFNYLSYILLLLISKFIKNTVLFIKEYTALKSNSTYFLDISDEIIVDTSLSFLESLNLSLNSTASIIC